MPPTTEGIWIPPQLCQAVSPSLLFFTVYVTSYLIDGFLFWGESKTVGGWETMAADSFRLVSFQLGILVKIDNLASLYSNLKYHGRALIGRLGSYAHF